MTWWVVTVLAAACSSALLFAGLTIDGETAARDAPPVPMTLYLLSMLCAAVSAASMVMALEATIPRF